MSNQNDNSQASIAAAIEKLISLTEKTNAHLELDMVNIENKVSEVEVALYGSNTELSLHLRIQELEKWRTEYNEKQKEVKDTITSILINKVLPWMFALLSSYFMASGMF